MGTITLDHTGPTVDLLTYSEGKYVLTISDDDAGIWKIEDELGTQVITGEIRGIVSDVVHGDENNLSKITQCTVRRDVVGAKIIRAYDHAENCTYIRLNPNPRLSASVTRGTVTEAELP